MSTYTQEYDYLKVCFIYLIKYLFINYEKMDYKKTNEQKKSIEICKLKSKKNSEIKKIYLLISDKTEMETSRRKKLKKFLLFLIY